MMYDCYIAGPFWTETQKQRMDNVIRLCRDLGLRVADPRELGPIIVDTGEKEKTPEFFRKIFQGNIDAMDQSFMILASLDDKDIGTAFELGYFYHNKKAMRPILSFAFGGAKTNVMLGQAVDRHFTRASDLEEFLRNNEKEIKNGDWMPLLAALEGGAKAESNE